MFDKMPSKIKLSAAAAAPDIKTVNEKMTAQKAKGKK
jgi:hypothetical protein